MADREDRAREAADTFEKAGDAGGVSRFRGDGAGTSTGMEGGIAILLILVILVVGGFIASGLFGAGGFLWWRKTDPRGDRVEGGTEAERRPQHTTPTTPAQEHTDFVGGE